MNKFNYNKLISCYKFAHEVGHNFNILKIYFTTLDTHLDAFNLNTDNLNVTTNNGVKILNYTDEKNIEYIFSRKDSKLMVMTSKATSINYYLKHNKYFYSDALGNHLDPYNTFFSVTRRYYKDTDLIKVLEAIALMINEIVDHRYFKIEHDYLIFNNIQYNLIIPVKKIKIYYFFIVIKNKVYVKELWEFFTNNENLHEYSELINTLKYIIEEFKILEKLILAIIEIEKKNHIS
jgi:hypothetical protein